MEKIISYDSKHKKSYFNRFRVIGICLPAIIFIFAGVLSVNAQDQGYALHFDGKDDYADCGNDKSINITDALTIEAWIMPLDWNTDTGFSMIADKGKFSLFLNGANNGGFNEHSLVFEFEHADGSVVQMNTLADSIRLDAWHHVAATYDGISYASIYINGEKRPATHLSDFPLGDLADNSEDPFYIGQSAEHDSSFSGSIDGIRIWSTMRRWAKIQATMFVVLKPQTGLEGCWPVNDDGDILVDISGKENTGTVYGAVIAEGRCESADYPTVEIANIDPFSSEEISVTAEVTDDGGAPVERKGVCWNTSGIPMLEKIDDYRTVVTGSKTGSFTNVIKRLEPDTIYYVRAYVTNCAGKTSYGVQKTFITPTMPMVRTIGAGSATSRTAMGAGSITDDGKGTIIARGVCWSVSNNPILESSDGYSEDGEGIGDFISSITGLTPDTTYYVRAYATNGAGTSYGEEHSFRTLPTGDVNGDDDINLIDAILVLKVLSDADTGDSRVNFYADVNGDNRLGFQEAIYLLRKVSGL
ncbi:MAG: hypothetical protein GY749_01395 [Desulfobacteraceae bacterium]|nr:hypothetical protein [Desulfobacteraceae bacterium]